MSDSKFYTVEHVATINGKDYSGGSFQLAKDADAAKISGAVSENLVAAAKSLNVTDKLDLSKFKHSLDLPAGVLSAATINLINLDKVYLNPL
jgi:hypothetical protein